MKIRVMLAAAGLMIVMSGQVIAEDLTGSEKILCAGVQAVLCVPSGDCELGVPWTWNLPEFVEIHLDDKIVSTTSAVERIRQTPIRTLERSEGEIFLQGVENGRAFSFVIDEESGVASIAIAADGMTFSVFGVCTPLAAAE